MEKLKQKFYIAISAAKWSGLNARLTKSNCGLKSNERLLTIEIEVPKSIFSTPQLSAKVIVPEDVISPPTIEVNTVNNIKELIQQNLGIDLEISVVNPEKTED